MKLTPLLLPLILSLLFAFQVQAQEVAMTVGAQTTEVDIDNAETDGGIGFFAGALGFVEMGNSGYIRTGALLSQRKFEREIGALTLEAETLSLDIPLTYLYMFSENAGVFGGVKLGLNVSDECDVSGGTGDCETEAESFYKGAEVGGHFRFTPNWGLEIAYDLGIGDIAEDVEWKHSLVAAGLFMF